jgi:hypothetical protein
MSAETYSSANESKATFDDIYNQPDPRDYFETLSDLGYVIPEQARPVFREVFGALRELREREGTSTKVVDLGCSYGINAALLKFGVSMDELEELYLDPGLSDAEPSTVTDRVADWLKRQPVHPFLEIVGLDSAERAVEYATRVGFLDDAVAVDLEEGAPPEDFDERLAMRSSRPVVSATWDPEPSNTSWRPPAPSPLPGSPPSCCGCSPTTGSQTGWGNSVWSRKSSKMSPSSSVNSPPGRSRRRFASASRHAGSTRRVWRPRASTTPSFSSPGRRPRSRR